MQRILGLLLLTIGTGIAAVFGAWLPGSGQPAHQARMAAAAHASMAKQVDKALQKAEKSGDQAKVARLTALQHKAAPPAPKGADGQPLSAPIGEAGVSLWASESALPFGLGVLLVIIGVVLARRGIKAEAHAAHAEVASSDAAPGPLLARLVEELATLQQRYGGTERDADSLDLEAVRSDIERVQHAIVVPLVEGREQISREFGVGPFADIFVPFSGAERQLNRVWSACVDGYVDEVAPCLDRAYHAAQQAVRAYDQASAAAS